MDNQENETTMPDPKKNQMNRTQNTFLSTSSSRKFRINTKYRLSSSNNTNKVLPPITTSNSEFSFHPINYQKSYNNFPSIPNKNDFLNTHYDSSNLKQRLSDNRMDMNKKNNELTELKIKYIKLFEENKNIKFLIANVLGVEVDSAFSIDEILSRIDQCNPSDETKKTLKEVHDIINLKMEINDKKDKISDLNQQIEYYTKNAKTKVINDLEREYIQKNDHQFKLEDLIRRMQNCIENNKIKIEELKKQYKQKKDLSMKIKSEFTEVESRIKETDEERESLDNIVMDLREKQRKMIERIKAHKYKNINEEAINTKKNDLKDIEDFIDRREKILKDIESRKNNIKMLEEEKNDLNEEIQELTDKNNQLSLKMDNYNKERPKLVQKSYEPLNNQRNMRDLEEKLRILRTEYEATQKQHEKKQNEYSEELSKLKEEIEDNKKVIEKNNNEQNKLNEEIADLRNKIEKINNDISQNENKINLKKKEMEDFISKEEQIKKEEEEKEKLNEEENKKNEEAKKKEQLKKEREHKKELDALKRQINNYTNENKYTEEESNNLKKEIEEFDKVINECADIDDKIKEAQEQLNKLKA